MSITKFDDNCPGCRPALILDGKVLPDDAPEMQVAMAVWEVATYEERLCFHKVTCDSSRDPEVMKIAQRLIGKMSAAIQALGGERKLWEGRRK